jgi:hypothetical protein
MVDLRNYYQYKSNFVVSPDTAKSRSYFIESTDLNQDGMKDVILFGFTFPNNGVTTAIPQGSIFYWGSNSGIYSQSSGASISLPATTHPREIAYADFNNDGKLDIFLADHGWDTSPFPGGQNQLILSSTTGWTISTSNLPNRNDFTHCTTVGDINNDGNIDIFLGNVDTSGSHYGASILFGDGTGHFSESISAVPLEIRDKIRFYAAQLTDLNRDGWLDLVIGNSGDTSNSKSESIVYWNKNGVFENSNSTLLPNGFFGAKNEQILDIQSGDINGDGRKDLVLLSTQNNPTYDGWNVQILSNQGSTFVDITTQAFGNNIHSMGTPNQAKQMPWIAFLKLVDVNSDGTLDILFDSVDSYGFASPELQPLIYLNDGFAHYSPIFANDVVDLNATYKEFFAKASSFVNEKGISWVSGFTYQDSIYFRELLPTKPLPKISSITATTGADTVIGNELDNTLFGLAGNDLLVGGLGNDLIDGGTGLDTVRVDDHYGLQNARNYSLARLTDGSWNVSFIGPTIATYPQLATNGSDTLLNVERLQFTDKSIALDLDGNAGKAAKIIGSVLGSASVFNPTFVGIGLNYLDKGMSYAELGELALKAIGAMNADAIVSTLWRNVVGFDASYEQKAPYIKMLSEGMKTGDLVVLAADTSFNTTNINLIGLAQTGIEYLPVS